MTDVTDTLLDDDLNDNSSLPSNSAHALDNALLVPINHVYPNPNQLRIRTETDSIEDLASSIKEVGILEPLIVTRKGKRKYILIAGHRRLQAARLAELAYVPCVVLELSNEAHLQYALIENLQRADLDPMEEANAIKQFIDQFGLTYREVADRIGKSATFVNDRIALLYLPDDLKAAIENNSLSLKKALELAKIPFENVRLKLMQKGAGGDLEAFKQLVSEEIDRRKAKKNPRDKSEYLPELKDFAKVHEEIHLFKNRISIRFDSPEKLFALLTELTLMLENYESDS